MPFDTEAWLYSHFSDNVPGDHRRINDRMLTGIPDTNYCLVNGSSGWIEFKHLHEWPARDTTKLTFGLRGDQAMFLRNRAKYGKAFLIARVENDIFLFRGKDAVTITFGVTRPEAMDLVLARWKDTEKLKGIIFYL